MNFSRPLLASLSAAAVLVASLCASPAAAHPFAKDTYSLYNALRVGEGTVSVVVVLEVPRTRVLEDIKRRIAEGTGKRKAVKEHDQSRFDALAADLALTVDGKPVDVTFRPLDHSSNGKVVEDFFLYWVGAEVPLDAAWGDEVEVTLKNTAYTDQKMVYSGAVAARGDWGVTGTNVTTVLGVDPNTLERNDPKAWTEDASLRTLTGTWARATAE